MEWISVKEKLPEVDQRVIIWNDELKDRENEPIRFGYLRKSGRFLMEGSPSDWNITHWMPLPEPPKTQAKK